MAASGRHVNRQLPVDASAAPAIVDSLLRNGEAPMREIQVSRARRRLAEMLRAVERGESFAITRHGKTVARLVPAASPEAQARREAVARFLALRGTWGKVNVTREEILAWRHEGHRF
jgi:prevent-host-death family protein